MKKGAMGYREALKITIETISPIGIEHINLTDCADRILADDQFALVDSPSIDASRKDGFALKSEEIEKATPDNRVTLKVIGSAAAGKPFDKKVTGGTAVRILTGAKIPDGADAVVAEEFTARDKDCIRVFENARPGRNILKKSEDVEAGELIVPGGSRLTPGRVGILAAAGHNKLPVYHRPKVAIVATGDELLEPGQVFSEGKLYASNLYILNGWCLRYGMRTTLALVKDRPEVITEKLAEAVAGHDAVMTIGGAWTGDRDFVANTLDALGWKPFFHRIRIGPGKAVGFGTLDNKPVFVLPGGPPSNLMAFLQIAMPGLLKLCGHRRPALPEMMVKLAHPLVSRDLKWTHFVYGTFRTGDEHTFFDPAPLRLVANRLKCIANAEGVVAVPEGVASLAAGAVIPAQLLV